MRAEAARQRGSEGGGKHAGRRQGCKEECPALNSADANRWGQDEDYDAASFNSLFNLAFLVHFKGG